MPIATSFTLPESAADLAVPEGSAFFITFTTSNLPETGESWCPDVRAALPHLNATFSADGAPEMAFVEVGQRPEWKVPTNVYRTTWNINNVPTLVRFERAGGVTKETGRLVEDPTDLDVIQAPSIIHAGEDTEIKVDYSLDKSLLPNTTYTVGLAGGPPGEPPSFLCKLANRTSIDETTHTINIPLDALPPSDDFAIMSASRGAGYMYTSYFTLEGSTAEWTQSETDGHSSSTANSQSVQQLHERLALVEEALRRQQSSDLHGFKTTPTSTPSATPNVEDETIAHHSLWEDHNISFEGDSSFRKQTYLASQIEELRIEAAQSPVVVDELENLKGIYQSHEAQPEAKQTRRLRQPHVAKAAQLQLLPSDFVIRLLRTVTENSVLFLFYAVENRAQVEDLCRRVYFSVEPVTIGEITLLNGFLSVLLRDINFDAHPEFSPEEVSRLYNLSYASFKAGVETYEVMAAPTFEHTLILSMASLRAQQDGNLPLQWTVMSAAARHCLALGYHRKARLAELPAQEARRARRLFWHVYFADRGLTLTQGKAPILQDFDIDTEPFEITRTPERYPWDASFAAFIEFGRIQTGIYEGLYSPASSRRSDEERRELVAVLDKRLRRWYETWQSVDYTHAYRKDLFQFTFEGIDVVYFSIMTLLHRGASSSNSASAISEECYEAARKGLTAHATAYHRSVSGGYAALFNYAVWTHLYSSFTPYIITFLHCIRNSDIEDLNLLRSTLEISERLSALVESCKRQYELCRSLYRIAEAYIKSKKGITCVDTALSSHITLPLQQPAAQETWSIFDPQLEHGAFSDFHVDDWNAGYISQMSFSLDNQLSKGQP
ncbi:Thioredoxin domain-containing protein [Colletotrichum sidae]|uniref:Thioredoxin domain-containing protein n=1 Tax=Colletotrichum sidae TaxID=1347389 RepID=A0A4R8THP7_9PEZI|nr:Thioredoxin domain-containing protein [Colletotrichum sidae]